MLRHRRFDLGCRQAGELAPRRKKRGGKLPPRSNF
jgi:hypothetical protein